MHAGNGLRIGMPNPTKAETTKRKLQIPNKTKTKSYLDVSIWVWR
jgi:hypothetical protein